MVLHSFLKSFYLIRNGDMVVGTKAEESLHTNISSESTGKLVCAINH